SYTYYSRNSRRSHSFHEHPSQAPLDRHSTYKAYALARYRVDLIIDQVSPCSQKRSSLIAHIAREQPQSVLPCFRQQSQYCQVLWFHIEFFHPHPPHGTILPAVNSDHDFAARIYLSHSVFLHDCSTCLDCTESLVDVLGRTVLPL